MIDSVYRAFALVFLAGVAPAAAQEAAPGELPPPAEATPTPTLAVATPVAALDCSALLDGAPSGPSALAGLAAEQLERVGAFQPGPLGDYLISELMKQVCSSGAVSSALSATCTPPAASDVRQLRARLVADAGHAIAAQADALSRRAGLTPESTEVLLLGVVLQAVIDTPSVRGLAQRLLQAAPGALERNCQVGGGAVDAYRDVRAAAVLILLLEQRAEQLTEADLQTYALRVLAETGQKAPNDVLSPQQRTALQRLVRALARARATQATRLEPAGYAELAGAYAEVVAGALSLAKDQSVTAPVAAVNVTSALARGEVVEALSQASGAVLGVNAGAVNDALVLGMRVVRARTEDEAKEILAKIALGVGPWADRWIVGINVGVPRLDFDDFKIAGDAKLGYNGERFGVVAKGYLSAYDFSSNVLLADTFLGGGSADFWVTVNPTSQFKWELRGDVGANVYDTESIPFGTNAGNLFSDETSLMFRGSALLGLRAEWPRAALGLWLGGGAENEQYNAITFDGNETTNIDDHTDWHALLTGRVRAQFPIVRQVLVGRVRGDLLRHSITRDSVALAVGSRGASSTLQATSSVQLEASGRAYIDLELAKFFGFVPAVEGGIDYFSLSDASGQVSTSVPVLGVGIRRTEF
ncbi:MAG TPA: hypothetical protein VHP33_18495 [Polyangiaceae bacterium]|nr:hypothetical protein [Polyangiaceae bacterium]